MGLLFSKKYYEYRRLVNTNEFEKRTFNGQTRLCKIIDIYDGDTFTIVTKLHNNEPYSVYKLRLYGFDAPEVKPLKSLPNRELHKEAGIHLRDMLRDCLPNGTIVYVDFKNEEKYGRLMGEVYTIKKNIFNITKNMNICNYLIDNKLVLPYTGQTKEDFNDTILNRILNINYLHIK